MFLFFIMLVEKFIKCGFLSGFHILPGLLPGMQCNALLRGAVGLVFTGKQFPFKSKSNMYLAVFLVKLGTRSGRCFHFPVFPNPDTIMIE